MGATIYIYIFFPFSLFVSVYVYASVCDFVCIALLLPFVLGFCLSVVFLFYYLKIFFLIIIFIFYFNNFILFYLLLPFFLFSFPFYSEPCGCQALVAPARCQGCASEVGEPTSGHWSTRDLPAPRNIKQ